jgi:two-component system OmpR family response regulator
MRILLIEDDTQVCSFIKKGLVEAGHFIDIEFNGKDGLGSAQKAFYDVIILDRMLPELDGIGVLQTLRTDGNPTPIIILSALADVEDRVLGLKSGGDDYLVKPFAFDELLARVEILGRRNASINDQTSKLKAGQLELDLITRRASREGQLIELQTREFKLLEYMLRHKNQIITRAMLLENVWDYHFDPQTNVIDVHISRLRNKVDKDFETQIIRTVRGSGYIIQDE